MPVAFIWVVIIILSTVIRTANKNKKEQEARQAYAKRAKPAPQGSAAPAGAAKKPEPKDDGWADRAMPRMDTSSSSLQAMKPSPQIASHRDAEPLEAHMHTPVMDAEGEGAEGMDCCHEYMLGGGEETEAADFLPLQEEEENERAAALLQGVIYSEILGRRPMKRYGGKRA